MVTIKVVGDDYKKCVVSSKNMWCSSKPGNYGKGLANTSNDKTKIERVSKLSEVAVAKLLQTLDPDFEYRRGGDNGVDLELCGLKLDVKCSMKNMRKNYFKGVNSRGNSTLKSDIYIFCYLGKEIKDSSAEINIVGYMTKQQVLDHGMVVPTMGWSVDKVNYEIPHRDMEDIHKLMEDLGITYGY